MSTVNNPTNSFQDRAPEVHTPMEEDRNLMEEDAVIDDVSSNTPVGASSDTFSANTGADKTPDTDTIRNNSKGANSQSNTLDMKGIDGLVFTSNVGSVDDVDVDKSVASLIVKRKKLRQQLAILMDLPDAKKEQLETIVEIEHLTTVISNLHDPKEISKSKGGDASNVAKGCSDLDYNILSLANKTSCKSYHNINLH